MTKAELIAERREYKRSVVQHMTVIREFYYELQRLGACPQGIYRWTRADARRFAQAILKAARMPNAT